MVGSVYMIAEKASEVILENADQRAPPNPRL